MSWLLGPVAMLCGVILTTQVANNKVLSEKLDNFYIPAAANMLMGLGFTLLLVWALTDAAPSREAVKTAPWWMWLAGGFLGTAYLTGNIILAPKLGAAALVGFVVAGQVIFSVLLDHFGWLGFEQHTAGAGRLVGSGLLLVGVFLIARY